MKRLFLALLLNLPVFAQAQTIKIGIMQAQQGEALKYTPMKEYLKTQGIDLTLVGFSNYADAAKKFANNEVDAMFAGSGVGWIMIIKDALTPERTVRRLRQVIG